MNIGRRLKEERNLKGLSQQQLADAVGIKQSAISQLESGASQKTTYVAAIAAKLGVNALWLETGLGPKYPNNQKDDAQQEDGPLDLIPRTSKYGNSVVYDLLDVRAACGTGLLNPDYPEIVQRLVMSSKTAQELIGNLNRAGNIKVILAAKDSMVPTINPNDLLFVDTVATEYKGEGIYIILHGGELLCKRLSLAGRNILVQSDNEKYASWLWSEKPDETRIIGKVLRALPMNFKNFGN